MLRRLLPVVMLAVLDASASWACPACACANPALTTLGVEPLYPGRLRLASAVRVWAEERGAVGTWSAQRLEEVRTDWTVTFAPSDRLALALSLPLLTRLLRGADLAVERSLGPGDVELSARWVAWRRPGLRSSHWLSLFGGARLPSSPTVGTRDGALTLDAQLAPGAWVGLLGLGYSGFLGERWSTAGAIDVELPSQGRLGFRPGPAVRATATAQLQPWRFAAVKALAEARVQAATSEWALHVGPEVVVKLSPEVLLLAGVRAPLVVESAADSPWRLWPTWLAAVLVDP